MRAGETWVSSELEACMKAKGDAGVANPPLLTYMRAVKRKGPSWACSLVISRALKTRVVSASARNARCLASGVS